MIIFIKFKNINLLAKDWCLYPPSTSIGINRGQLFYEIEKYNLKTIVLALIINLGIIAAIGIYSHKQIKRRMRNEEFDSVL